MKTETGVTLLFGNDEFAIARRLSELAAAFPDPTTADMNVARLEARTAGENDLNNAVNAMPFLAKYRLVMLANPSGRYTTPGARKKFLAFLEAVPPTTRLVLHELVEPNEVEKHWLVKWAGKKGAAAQAFMLPRPKEMAGWIVNEAKRQGGAIEPRAAARLAELAGADPRQAAQEIAKLLAYVNWARAVTLEDVGAVSLATAEPDIFAMVDALAVGDGRTAQRLLHRLIENDDPFSVWGMVVRQFRLLLLAREVLDGGGGKDQVTHALAAHPYVGEKVTGQARRFNLAALEAIHHRLLGIDEAAKTGQVPLELALDGLVVELAQLA